MLNYDQSSAKSTYQLLDVLLALYHLNNDDCSGDIPEHKLNYSLAEVKRFVNKKIVDFKR